MNADRAKSKDQSLMVKKFNISNSTIQQFNNSTVQQFNSFYLIRLYPLPMKPYG